MSYAHQYKLSTDREFTTRLEACLVAESRTKLDDPVAQGILRSPMAGTAAFTPFISSAPGFADKFEANGQASITDADLLAAVQAAWQPVTDLRVQPV